MSDLKPCPFGCHAKITLCSGGPPIILHGNKYCPLSNLTIPLSIWNRRAHDATETAALTKIRNDIAITLAAGPGHVLAVVFKEWLAVLDAILKERE